MWRIFLVAVVLWFPASAQAEWHEAETPHFKIYSGGSEKQLVRFAERLETVDALLRMATATSGDQPPVKVRVILLDDINDVARAYQGSRPNIVGFYTVNMHGPVAVAPRRTGDTGVFGPEVVLFHEYAHHFMLQYLPGAYPSWIIEGFAEMISTADVMSNGRVNYGKAASHRGYSLTSQRWIPVADLLNKPADQLPRDGDFYGQSWLLAHYLILSDKRPGQAGRYLGLLKQGATREAAAREAFGDLDELNREVRAYLARASFPYRPVEVDRASVSQVKLRELSPGEAALMFDLAAFRDSMPEKARADYLDDLRRKVAKYPGDAFALRLLADAEFAAEDYPASLATAERLLALQPDDRKAMLRKGEILLQQASQKDDGEAAVAEARKLIVAANRADPDDPQALIAFYQSYRVAGERPPAIAIKGLEQAVGTVPQDQGARMMLVTALANAERYGEAASYLEPIAYAPHQSERTEQALELLVTLREKAAKKKTS